MPHVLQETIQIHAAPLVADTREHTRFLRPDAAEIIHYVVVAESLETVAGTVVAVVDSDGAHEGNAIVESSKGAHDGSTADESRGSSEQRDNGGDGEQHCWFVSGLGVFYWKVAFTGDATR